MSEQADNSGGGCVTLLVFVAIAVVLWFAADEIDKLRWELRDAQRRISILEQER